MIMGMHRINTADSLKICIQMTLADTFCVVCEELNLVIWNGFLPGDEEGNYTYIAHNGSSVIDYCFAFKMS